MRLIAAIALIALCLSGCRSYPSAAEAARNNSTRLTQDEKHRLYTAALAASDSPLDTDLFKEVCQKIGIVDAAGKTNEAYMSFVTEHVNWGMKSESNQFRQTINTKEKAREYITQHLP